MYGFLSRPAHLPRWAPVTGSHEQIGPHRWRSEFERGTFEIEFSPQNAFGVLDYAMTHGATGAVQPFAMRVVPDGVDSVLMLTLFQRDGVTDEQSARKSSGRPPTC